MGTNIKINQRINKLSIYQSTERVGQKTSKTKNEIKKKVLMIIYKEWMKIQDKILIYYF